MVRSAPGMAPVSSAPACGFGSWLVQGAGGRLRSVLARARARRRADVHGAVGSQAASRRARCVGTLK